jgi:choline dehydrogenase-like flavoprotein
MEFVMELVQQPAMVEFFGPIMQPEIDENFTDYAQQNFANWVHGVGTCRMGSPDDTFAVVDPSLRLRGIENLWVADASVIPLLPHSNTNFSAIIAGEIAARSVRAT